jgi:hypothetical protein
MKEIGKWLLEVAILSIVDAVRRGLRRKSRPTQRRETKGSGGKSGVQPPDQREL